MARNDFSLGNAARVGFSLQAAGSTGGWGGTPTTMRWFVPRQGGASFHGGRTQEHDPETMTTDPEHITTGGSRCSGTFSVPLSYAYMEGIHGNICGAPTVKSEASAPYLHTGTASRGPVYGQVALYWDNYKGTRFQILANNVLITKLTLKADDKKVPYYEVSWYGQKWTQSTPGAAPTVVVMEFPEWDHGVLTIGGATMIHKGFTMDIDWPAEEDDYGTGGADDPAPVFIARGGQRILTFTVNAVLDDEILGILLATPSTAIEDNNFLWNNSGTTTAEREFKVTLGDLKMQDTDIDLAKFGRLPVTLVFKTEGATPFLFETQNALSADEPPAA